MNDEITSIFYAYVKFSILNTYIQGAYVVWDDAKVEKKIRANHIYKPGCGSQGSGLMLLYFSMDLQRSARVLNSIRILGPQEFIFLKVLRKKKKENNSSLVFA